MIKIKAFIEKGIQELGRWLYSDHVRFGDHVQFGFTSKESSKIKMKIKDQKP